VGFWHGDPEFHREDLKPIGQVAEELGKSVASLADLRGPKLRDGMQVLLDAKRSMGYERPGPRARR